ncbi:type II secretion system protein GspD [Arcobacter sp. FWKO B]|uniref:type II secretion system protein GspD n=1 Tax=Arcobacter sp. FWKO B TaxID=2593672 RepID=UPI001906AC47|nr:hypothetical protein [Arcobacter sp. FWKO B]
MYLFFYLFRIMLYAIILSNTIFADTKIDLRVKELELVDFVHLVSKTTKKNIIMIDKPKGSVEFALFSKISENELENILDTTLQANGYALIKNNDIFTIVDKSKINTKSRKIIELKNIEAQFIQEIISNSYDKDNASVDVDRYGNLVILYGNEQYINKLEAFIKELDIEKLQIYVEAKIIEISEIGFREVGFKYGLNSALLSGNSLYTLSAELGLKGGKVTIPSGFDLNYPTSLVKSSLNLWTTLSLLQTNNALEIISEPSILALNNQESSIYVGKRQSIQTSTTTDKNGNPIPNMERVDIGLSLKVKPRITSDNKVMLDIKVQQEEASENGASLSPVSDKKEIQTTAIVQSGENVILGGYIKNKSNVIEDSVPFFSSLPIFGNLFKYNKDSKDKISLVVILTPHIVPSSKDLTYLQYELTKLKMLESKYSKDLLNKLEYKKEDKTLNITNDLYSEALKSFYSSY